MTLAGIFLGAAVLGGGLAQLLRLPPLVGFLIAGFTLKALGVPEPVWLRPAADLGVTVLLFAIGLKLELSLLTRRRIWATTTVHVAATVLVVTPLLIAGGALGLPPIAGTGPAGLALVAFALSFSSTVLAFKILEDRGESASLHGQVVIGILIIQDLLAVAFIMVSRGALPSPWALTLLALPLVVWLLRVSWSHLGRGELLPLFGLAVALIPGYLWFEAVGLKGDLGARCWESRSRGHDAPRTWPRPCSTSRTSCWSRSSCRSASPGSRPGRRWPSGCWRRRSSRSSRSASCSCCASSASGPGRQPSVRCP